MESSSIKQIYEKIYRQVSSFVRLPLIKIIGIYV